MPCEPPQQIAAFPSLQLLRPRSPDQNCAWSVTVDPVHTAAAAALQLQCVAGTALAKIETDVAEGVVSSGGSPRQPAF